MKAHLHFVISAAVVAGEVATRDWSTVDVPDLLTLNAASAATAGSTADGGAPNESTFAPTCGTVDTAERVVREAAPGGAAGAAAQTTTTAAAAAVAAAVALPPRPPRPDNWATMSRKQRQNWKLRAGRGGTWTVVMRPPAAMILMPKMRALHGLIPRSPEFPALAVVREKLQMAFRVRPRSRTRQKEERRKQRQAG